MTFIITRHGRAIWLCTTDGKSEKRIAKFVSKEAAQSFVDVLNAAKAAMHAMGQMGI